MEIIENNSKINRKDDSSLRIQDILSICLARWRWFVLSLVITLGAAAVYLLRTPSVYTRSASILIKEDSKGQSVSSEMDFANLGLFQSSTNVNNEMLTLRSPATMYEVARRLSLHKTYMADGRFHKVVAYGTSLPLTVDIAGFPESEGAGMTVTVAEDGSVALGDFSRNGEDIGPGPVQAALGKPVSTPVGEVTVFPTPFFTKGNGYTIYFTQTSIQAAASSCASNMTIARAEEGASVINLTMKDVSVQRADDILNTLIAVYNENWVKDKNQIAVSTSVFINERLAIIENELGTVDESISSYKSEHMIPDLNTASNMYISQSVEANTQILQLNNQLYMVRYIRDHLTNEANRYDLLPATGTENSGIESQISEYNTMLLQRNNLVTASSTSNPVVVDMDHNLDAMRSAIVSSLDNHRVMLETQLRTLESTEQQASDRIAATPDQAKYLLSVERQQKVKEALYLFLLQKREENELSQAFTAYNTRIITPPTGSGVPTSPAKTRIMLIALVIGLIVPIGIIFLKELTNSKVRGRKDVEWLSMPFLGEIPQISDGKRHGTLQSLTDAIRRYRNKGKREKTESGLIAVKEGSRDIVNEAFRVLRTNLEFMIRKDGRTDIILVTSFNPGSGKTFIAMNLGMALAIKKQRVLVIDGDLRHGSASRFAGSPGKGLSNWLGGQSGSYLDLIVHHPGHPGLDILPIGTIPPNPTELISDSRMFSMLEDLRGRYDCIFIDCPPINIVADTQIFERLADRTVFIVRAGLLERSMLSELEDIYRQGQFRNMSLILNGTEGGGRYGYHHGYRYGYRYGYHYGYYGHSYYGNSK
jgi:tyrosine-protein kinase Etk/Wzc